MDATSRSGQRHCRASSLDTVGVGQGSSASEVSIDFSRSSSVGRSLAKSAELDVEFTIGYMVAGFLVGGGLTHTTTISHGESTTYVGTVGSIDSTHFANEQYRFGNIHVPAGRFRVRPGCSR